MEKEFKPLAEEDFKSPEEFAAFNAAKENFIRPLSLFFGFDTKKQDNSKWPSNHDWPPVLQIIDAEQNAAIRAHMVEELIHADISDIAKVALAKEYMVKTSSGNKAERSNIPSLETMVVLLKSAKNIYPKDPVPQQLRDNEPGALQAQLNVDMPVLTLEDHKFILEMEEKYESGKNLSRASASVLTSQLSQRLVNAHDARSLSNVTGSIHSLADITRDYGMIAESVRYHLSSLPHAWRDEEVRLQSDKKRTHETLLQNGLNYNSRPPVGATREEQVEDLEKRISQTERLINASADNVSLSPSQIISAVGQLKKHQADLNVGTRDSSYDLTHILEKFKTIVDNGISSNKVTRLEGFTALIDMRILHPDEDKSYSEMSIDSRLPKIAEKANNEEALKIYDVYQQKAPILTAKNRSEGFASWPLAQDAHKRISQNRGDLQPEMMDALINLSRMQNRDGKPTMNHLFTDLFKTLPVDSKKLLLSKMLNKDFPEAGSENLNELVKIVKDTKDKELIDGAYLLAAKTFMKDIKAGENPDAPYQDKRNAEYSAQNISRMYMQAADQADHKILRGMIREQGAAAGMDNEKVGGVLKTIREKYRGSENAVTRGIRTFKSYLRQGKKMTDLLELDKTAPKMKPALQ